MARDHHTLNLFRGQWPGTIASQINFQGRLSGPIPLQSFFKGNGLGLSHSKVFSRAMARAHHTSNLFRRQWRELITLQIYFKGNGAGPSHSQFISWAMERDYHTPTFFVAN